MLHNIISIVKPTRCTNVFSFFFFLSFFLFIYINIKTPYVFRVVFPSITRSSRLYIQQQAFVRQILLSTCWQADGSICLSKIKKNK